MLVQVAILRTVGLGRVAVSVFFAQLDYAGDTFYIMSANFASADLLNAAVAVYLFPIFLFAFIQRRFVVKHLRAVHRRGAAGPPLLWKFGAVNGLRVKHFTFSSYDEFYKAIAYVAGFILFTPVYVLWAVLVSPLWAFFLLRYATFMLGYAFVLFLYTNCKPMGIQELALLFAQFGGTVGAGDEESGGRGADLQELNALLNSLFAVELLFESLPQLIISSLNEIAVAKAHSNTDLGVLFYA